MPKSKSAYSTPTKVSKLETHIIVVWVDNDREYNEKLKLRVKRFVDGN